MSDLVIVTGITDNQGLATLRKLLAPHFGTAATQGALRSLSLWYAMPEYYLLQLDAICTLVLVRRGPRGLTQEWQFCLTVVTHKRVVHLPQSFLGPGVDNLKDVYIHRPGMMAPQTATSA